MKGIISNYLALKVYYRSSSLVDPDDVGSNLAT
jgi:hypothetical protein